MADLRGPVSHPLMKRADCTPTGRPADGPHHLKQRAMTCNETGLKVHLSLSQPRVAQVLADLNHPRWYSEHQLLVAHGTNALTKYTNKSRKKRTAFCLLQTSMKRRCRRHTGKSLHTVRQAWRRCTAANSQSLASYTVACRSGTPEVFLLNCHNQTGSLCACNKCRVSALLSQLNGQLAPRTPRSCISSKFHSGRTSSGRTSVRSEEVFYSPHRGQHLLPFLQRSNHTVHSRWRHQLRKHRVRHCFAYFALQECQLVSNEGWPHHSL